MKSLRTLFKLKLFVALAIIFFGISFITIVFIGSQTKDDTTTSTAQSTPNSTVLNKTYCGGQTSCYGKTELAQHSTSDSCWGYIDNVMYDVTPLINSHSGRSGPIIAVCGGDIGAALNAAPGNSKHRSASSNKAGSTLWGYKIGYYDAAKP